MSKAKQKTSWFTPLTYFVLMFLLGIGVTGLMIWLLIRGRFSWMLVFMALFCLTGTVLFAMDIKRFRLTPEGLVIQHLLTRRRRVIPYPAIEKIGKMRELKTRGHPEIDILQIHHNGRVDELKFFVGEVRNNFLRQLETCRQGKVVDTVGKASLPAAQVVVSQSQGWVYPWRRAE